MSARSYKIAMWLLGLGCSALLGALPCVANDGTKFIDELVANQDVVPTISKPFQFGFDPVAKDSLNEFVVLREILFGVAVDTPSIFKSSSFVDQHEPTHSDGFFADWINRWEINGAERIYIGSLESLLNLLNKGNKISGSVTASDNIGNQNGNKDNPKSVADYFEKYTGFKWWHYLLYLTYILFVLWISGVFILPNV